MSDDGTSGYAPKSPDLSSFYSTPAEPTTTSTAANKSYDYHVHKYIRGNYPQPPPLPPTSAWHQDQTSPPLPSPSSSKTGSGTYNLQLLFDQQQQQQQQQQVLHRQGTLSQQGTLPQQPPHYVPPSPSHHEYHPPHPITPGGGYQYNPAAQQQPQQLYSAPYGYQTPASAHNPYAHGHSHSHSSSTSTQPAIHDEHFQGGACTSSPTMPPRRAAAAAAPVDSDTSASDSNGPIVRTKFPTARIKRIMQADEEVGKVAQSTPIAVSKALELFMIQLVIKSAEQARQKGSRRVSAQMLKDVIEGDEQWDFLRDISSKVEEMEKKGRGAKADASESEEEPVEGKRRGRGRKKKTG